MSSSKGQQQVVQHFTHIHPLTKIDGIGEFICDGCVTRGSGKKAYHCASCKYNLHEDCATSPLTVRTFLHPQHELSLVVRKEKSTRQRSRTCDICEESVEGMFYRCKQCNFDVHPLCTLFLQFVSHVHHPAHPLEFRLGGARPCKVCHGPCPSWRYSCEVCRFDIHWECFLGAAQKSNPNGRTMDKTLRDITIGVVSNIIAFPICEILSFLSS